MTSRFNVFLLSCTVAPGRLRLQMLHLCVGLTHLAAGANRKAATRTSGAWGWMVAEDYEAMRSFLSTSTSRVQESSQYPSLNSCGVFLFSLCAQKSNVDMKQLWRRCLSCIIFWIRLEDDGSLGINTSIMELYIYIYIYKMNHYCYLVYLIAIWYI